MSNGTSGDINNINFGKAGPGKTGPVRADPRRRRQRRPGRLRRLQEDQAPRLGAAGRWPQKEIELGVRLPDEQDVARAKEILAKAKRPVLKTLPEVYARETVLLAKYPAQVKVKLQAIRIGELGIVGHPVRDVRRDRPGDQEEKPAEADVHHRAGQRLQRLSADAGAAQAGRLRDLAGALELSGGGGGAADHGDGAGTVEGSGEVISAAPARASSSSAARNASKGVILFRSPQRQQGRHPLPQPATPARAEDRRQKRRAAIVELLAGEIRHHVFRLRGSAGLAAAGGTTRTPAVPATLAATAGLWLLVFNNSGSQLRQRDLHREFCDSVLTNGRMSQSCHRAW